MEKIRLTRLYWKKKLEYDFEIIQKMKISYEKKVIIKLHDINRERYLILVGKKTKAQTEIVGANNVE